MSFGRAAGPILATICGVCTAYATLGPELQKQAAEKQFGDQHSTTAPSTPNHSPDVTTPSQPTIISNDKSIGQEVKEAVQETKTEVAAAKPKAGWFGLSAWGAVFGGAESPREDDEKKA